MKILLTLKVIITNLGFDLNYEYRLKDQYISIGSKHTAFSSKVGTNWSALFTSYSSEAGAGLIFQKQKIKTDETLEDLDQCLFVGGVVQIAPLGDRLVAYQHACKGDAYTRYQEMVSNREWVWNWKHNGKTVGNVHFQGENKNLPMSDELWRRRAFVTVRADPDDKETVIATTRTVDTGAEQYKSWHRKVYLYDLADHWVNMRKLMLWNSSRTNVAVMGLNNVGKSTFLNTIIGAKEESFTENSAPFQFPKPFQTGAGQVTKWEMVSEGTSFRDCDHIAEGLTFWDLPGMQAESVDDYAQKAGLRFFDAIVIAVENELQESDIHLIAHVFKSNNEAKVYFVKTKMNILLKSRWEEDCKQGFPDCLLRCPDLHEAQEASRATVLRDFDATMTRMRMKDKDTSFKRWVDISAKTTLSLSTFFFLWTYRQIQQHRE